MAGINLLTDNKIKHAKEGFMSDGGNLYVRTRVARSSFMFKYRMKDWQVSPGKLVEIGLGVYPALSLAAARELATKMRSNLANRIDPKLVIKPEAEVASVVKTFHQYAQDFIADQKSGWKSEKHLGQWKTTIEDHAKPIHELSPVAITTQHIYDLLKPMWESKANGGRIETASRLRGRIELVLAYAFVKEGVVKPNPALWRGNLSALLPKVTRVTGEKKHLAAPPYQVVPTIMAKLRKLDTTPALALRYSILTAARSSEVRLATFSEINIEAATHTIPGPRMKKDAEHVIPLNAEAVEILKTMTARRSPDKELIFRNRKGDEVCDKAINRTLEDIYPGITAHGLARSCFSDWAAEQTGFASAVVEASLAHKDTNKVRAAYQRTNFLALRRELMLKWGEYCSSAS
jgi:integrase